MSDLEREMARDLARLLVAFRRESRRLAQELDSMEDEDRAHLARELPGVDVGALAAGLRSLAARVPGWAGPRH